MALCDDSNLSDPAFLFLLFPLLWHSHHVINRCLWPEHIIIFHFDLVDMLAKSTYLHIQQTQNNISIHLYLICFCYQLMVSLLLALLCW